MKKIILSALMLTGLTNVFSQSSISHEREEKVIAPLYSSGVYVGLSGFSTGVNLGVNLKNRFQTSLFILHNPLKSINFYGLDNAVNLTPNNPGFNILLGLKVGLYNNNFGVTYPYLEQRWLINKRLATSLNLGIDQGLPSLEAKIVVSKF